MIGGADDRERSRVAREDAYDLRRWAGRVSRTRRVRDCLGSGVFCPGQGVLPVLGHVGLAEDGSTIAGFSQVARCGALNLCPWCARKGREERAKRVNELVAPFLRVGGRAAFVVCTIAGLPGEQIWRTKQAMSRVNAAFRVLLRKSGFAQRAGLIGTISGWEFTVRLDGSGHPHRNELMLFTEAAYDEVERLRDLWCEAARSCGRRAHAEHGMRVEFPELDESGTIRVLSEYITKGAEHWGAGQELCRADRKVSRSADSFAPFDLLRLIREDGDVGEHAALVKAWRAYERASSGTAVARLSRGLEVQLRRIAEAGNLAGVVVPGDDEDLEVDEAATVAAEEALVEEAPMEAPAVVSFDRRAWSFVHRHGLAALILRVLEDVHDMAAEEGVVADYVHAVRYLLEVEGAAEHEVEGVTVPVAQPVDR